jgi:hypothetical protein
MDGVICDLPQETHCDVDRGEVERWDVVLGVEVGDDRFAKRGVRGENVAQVQISQDVLVIAVCGFSMLYVVGNDLGLAVECRVTNSWGCSRLSSSQMAGLLLHQLILHRCGFLLSQPISRRPCSSCNRSNQRYMMTFSLVATTVPALITP